MTTTVFPGRDPDDLDDALATLVGLGEVLEELLQSGARRIQACREQLLSLGLDPDAVLGSLDPEALAEAEALACTPAITEPVPVARPPETNLPPHRSRLGRMI